MRGEKWKDFQWEKQLDHWCIWPEWPEEISHMRWHKLPILYATREEATGMRSFTNKQILAYLAGTIHYGISFGGEEMNAKTPLVSYYDAALASDLIKRKSTTGVCVFFHGGLVFWDSKRQLCPQLNLNSTQLLIAHETSFGSEQFLRNWVSHWGQFPYSVTVSVREA